MFFLVPVPEAAMSAMDVAVKWREALGATTERSRECMCMCSLDAAFLNMATQQVMQSMRALQARVWIESCTVPFWSFARVAMLLRERGVFQSVVLLNACMSACVAWPASFEGQMQ